MLNKIKNKGWRQNKVLGTTFFHTTICLGSFSLPNNMTSSFLRSTRNLSSVHSGSGSCRGPPRSSSDPGRGESALRSLLEPWSDCCKYPLKPSHWAAMALRGARGVSARASRSEKRARTKALDVSRLRPPSLGGVLGAHRCAFESSRWRFFSFPPSDGLLKTGRRVCGLQSWRSMVLEEFKGVQEQSRCSGKFHVSSWRKLGRKKIQTPPRNFRSIDFSNVFPWKPLGFI